MAPAEHIRQFLQAAPTASRYVVGYSGGLDSQVLLHLLHAQGLTNLETVHVHHGLSASADAWADFCLVQCAALGVPCRVERVAVADGGGLEAAARAARYAALENHLDTGDMLLTAHHQDDQAETVLLMLLRGTGVAGLAAMPRWRRFARGWLGRPLLDVSRAALLDYAKTHNLAWIEDESNQDTRLRRNYLRHEILPRLERHWLAARPTLARAASQLAEAGGLLADLAEMDRAQSSGSRAGTLSLQALASMDAARRRNLLRYWVKACGLPMPDSRQLHRLERDLFTPRADAEPRVDWPGAEIRRYRDDLYALAPLPPAPQETLDWTLDAPLPLADGRRLQAVACTGKGLSAARLKDARISVGFYRGAERCKPAGRAHSQTLKKLFQQAGVPPWERERAPLLFVEGELAQVIGHWICAGFAAGAQEIGFVVGCSAD